jgi:hypothetical protein
VTTTVLTAGAKRSATSAVLFHPISRLFSEERAKHQNKGTNVLLACHACADAKIKAETAAHKDLHRIKSSSGGTITISDLASQITEALEVMRRAVGTGRMDLAREQQVRIKFLCKRTIVVPLST